MKWTEEEIKYLKHNYPTEAMETLTQELSRKPTAIRKKAEREGVSKHPQFELINSIRSAPNTPEFDDEAFNNYIVGLVDGEGSFTTKGNQHQFSIQLVREDFEILEDMGEYFGVGHTSTHNRNNENWSEIAHYYVQNYGELVNVIIPFFDEYTPRAEKKRFQYQYWREEVLGKVNFEIERFK